MHCNLNFYSSILFRFSFAFIRFDSNYLAIKVRVAIFIHSFSVCVCFSVLRFHLLDFLQSISVQTRTHRRFHTVCRINCNLNLIKVQLLLLILLMFVCLFQYLSAVYFNVHLPLLLLGLVCFGRERERECINVFEWLGLSSSSARFVSFDK